MTPPALPPAESGSGDADQSDSVSLKSSRSETSITYDSSPQDLRNILKTGWLLKKVDKKEKKFPFGREYQKKFCVISGNALCCCEKESDMKGAVTISLDGYEARDVDMMSDTRKSELKFDLVSPGKVTYT
ncbi:PREDICTED: src kinase-associated phosphoprotein 2-A-like, partial [Priapulus caudatus]|uniref:Src kinase-associated phosphoprotein 2-A-like n=1 Tax=Priapulus caudatus TaxID=37621 RepID=A0ABM1F703_PRICU